MRKAKIPNWLTACRMALFVPVVVLASVPLPVLYGVSFDFAGSRIALDVTVGYFAAGVLFALSCLTDWLDGYLARRWNVASDWGRLWDPLADKVLINSLYVALAAQGVVHFAFAVALIARDIVMDGFRLFAINKGVLVAANVYGKLKTVFQMFACLLSLLLFTFRFDPLSSAVGAAVWFWAVQMLPHWAAVVFSLLSLGIYWAKTAKAINVKNETKSI